MDFATLATLMVATARTRQKVRPRQWRDFRDRSGFPRGAGASRGVAADFQAPRDVRALPGPMQQETVTN